MLPVPYPEKERLMPELKYWEKRAGRDLTPHITGLLMKITSALRLAEMPQTVD